MEQENTIQIEKMAYIAREKCGCITGATVDEPRIAKHVAKDVAGWIKDGRTVERVSSEIVKISFGICPLDSTKKWEWATCGKQGCPIKKIAQIKRQRFFKAIVR